MAEVTALRNNVLQYPIYGLPWVIEVPIFKSDGTRITSGTISATISKNGDTAGATTNTPTQIATTSGKFYLILTATEMTTNVVSLEVTSDASGAIATPITLYPQVLPSIATGTSSAGAAGTITLQVGSSAYDDFYNGAVIYTTGGTGLGQARMITNYVGSTLVASVTPNFATNPSSDTTYTIYQTPMSYYAWSGATLADVAAVILATPANLLATDLSGRVQVQVGTSAGQINSSGGKVPATLASTDVTGKVPSALASTDVTGNLPSDLKTVTAGVDFSTTMKTSIGVAARDVDNTSPATGSLGAKVNTAATAGDPWNIDLPGSYAAGKAGKIVGDNLNAPVGTVDTVVDAIKLKTDLIPAAPAAVSDIPTAAAVASATIAKVVETQGSITLQQALSIMLSALAGVTSDSGATLKTPNGSATRIAATIDSSQNRTAMVLSPSA